MCSARAPWHTPAKHSKVFPPGSQKWALLFGVPCPPAACVLLISINNIWETNQKIQFPMEGYFSVPTYTFALGVLHKLSQVSFMSCGLKSQNWKVVDAFLQDYNFVTVTFRKCLNREMKPSPSQQIYQAHRDQRSSMEPVSPSNFSLNFLAILFSAIFLFLS